mmetsp:Transcript_106690/g.283782  ORF Transcript_106690/g.283782 Transcript_106690/m.283782 type:complete len:207 (+) Transcript_106690:288-908(+)
MSDTALCELVALDVWLGPGRCSGSQLLPAECSSMPLRSCASVCAYVQYCPLLHCRPDTSQGQRLVNRRSGAERSSCGPCANLHWLPCRQRPRASNWQSLVFSNMDSATSWRGNRCRVCCSCCLCCCCCACLESAWRYPGRGGWSLGCCGSPCSRGGGMLPAAMAAVAAGAAVEMAEPAGGPGSSACSHTSAALRAGCTAGALRPRA